MNFSDQAYAGKFRDIVTRIARRVITDERPDVRIGKVYSFDVAAQFAMVLFAGETVDNLVKVRFAKNMIPVNSMATEFESLGYEAAGDLVRVWGKPGSYFLLDYYSGGPPSVSDRDSVHGNPDFDAWSIQAKTSGQTTLFPTEWTPFWQNDNAVNEQSTDTIFGGYSLRVTRAAGASGNVARVHSSTVFGVQPGDSVTFDIYMKASDASAFVDISLITASTEVGADLNSGHASLQVDTQSIPISTSWRRYSVSYVVPTGNTFARFSLLPNTASAVLAINYWFDDSGSVVITPSAGQQAISGEVKMWPTAAAPNGYLLCNGAVYNNSDYPALSAVIGNTYGGTPGSTFAVPDLRGRLPLGASSTVALNSNEGVAEASRNLSHTHPVGTLVVSDRDLNQVSNTTTGGTSNRLTSPNPHNHTLSGSTGNQPNTGTNSIPHLGINFIIKT